MHHYLHFSSFAHLGSISSTFYEQLLCMQISKAQKIQSSCQSFFALSGSALIKAACRMLMKLTPGFNQRFFFEYFFQLFGSLYPFSMKKSYPSSTLSNC